MIKREILITMKWLDVNDDSLVTVNVADDDAPWATNAITDFEAGRQLHVFDTDGNEWYIAPHAIDTITILSETSVAVSRPNPYGCKAENGGGTDSSVQD